MTSIAHISPEILNTALAMSLEWGENFMKPIDGRIREKYPQLTEADAEALRLWCAEVTHFAFELIEQEFPQIEKGAPGTATTQVRTKYPEVDDENQGRLNSQGMYYAWHG